MIMENNSNNNEPQPEGPPRVCATCAHWFAEMALIHPNGQGIAPCKCNEDEAPHGEVTAGFGSCVCWVLRKRQLQIVVPPKGLNLRRRLKIP